MTARAHHRAGLGEIPELLGVVVAKFVEHDQRYQRGGKLERARRRVETFAGAGGEIACRDVWTDAAHDAVVCETADRGRLGPLVALAAVATPAILIVGALPLRIQVALLVIFIACLIWIAPRLVRELRRSRRHRRGARVLTFLASRRPGAGRALLEARCAAADRRGEWLCLDAPLALEWWYSESGFTRVGGPFPDARGALLYMEREPGTAARAEPESPGAPREARHGHGTNQMEEEPSGRTGGING